MTTSIWITVTITIERFVFLYNSGGDITGRSTGRSSSSAGWILTGIVILATLLCIPLFFYLGNPYVDKPVEISDFARGRGYEAYSWIRMFAVHLIPIVIVGGLNIAFARIIKINNDNLKYTVLPVAVFEEILSNITVILF